MEYKIATYSIFEFGQRKDEQGNPHQEDSAWPHPGNATPEDRLFIVCDGMGGHDAGEVASQTVCEVMSASILGAGRCFDEDLLQKALSDALDALDSRDTGAKKKMGTTMALLALHPQGATIAHIGDSRVYHIRPGRSAKDTQILFKTQDHSLVNALILAGELTEKEAKTFPRRNVITRAMQPHLDPRPKADVAHITDIRAGDWFYLCSDGMLENMDDKQLRHNFSHAAGYDEKKRDGLVRATQFNKDNHTAILVHILDVLGNDVIGVLARDKGSQQEIVSGQVKKIPSVLFLLVLLVAIVAAMLRIF